jgi:hypothetical protein
LLGCFANSPRDADRALIAGLAREAPAFTLAHCWSHAKRKYGPFPADAAAQDMRRQLRQERSRQVVERIWQ